MKKKLLVFLLVIVLALGALGLNAFAGTEESTTTPVATAMWTANNSVTVDGSASEANWMFDSWIRGETGTPEGSVAKLWNGTDLYFAVKTDGASSLKATLNGKAINVTLGSNPSADMDGVTVKQSGNILEMKVPFASIGFVMHGYTQQMGMVLELKNSSGTSKFDGSLTFNGQHVANETVSQAAFTISTYDFHNAKYGYTSGSGKTATNPSTGVSLQDAITLAQGTGQVGAKTETVNGESVYHLWNKYQSGEANYMVQYSRVDVKGLGNPATLAGAAVLDFDVKIADLPEVKNPKSSAVCSNTYQTTGFGVGFSRVNAKEELAVSIANKTGVGLVLYVKTANGATYDEVILNRQPSDETMHMSIRYGKNTSVTVLIDDVQVYHNPQVGDTSNGYFGANNVLFTLWNPAYDSGNTNAIIGSDYVPLSSAYDGDVYVSNVKLTTLNEGDLLEELTFDTIKGSNSDPSAVSGNLNLPAKLEDPNGKFSADLQWTSSPAGYIAADGKVTPPQELTDVVLTATVAGSDPAITKSFNLTVSMPPVDAWKADAVNFDGNTDEYYNFARGAALTAEAGKPSGSVAARWTEDTLYIGAKYENAEILALMVGDKVVEVDLVNKTVAGLDGAAVKVGTGTVEIALPLSALELEIGKGTSVSMGVILAGTAGENGKSLLMSFYGVAEKAELAWVDSITVDGKLNEKAWQMYHKAAGRAGTPAGVVGQLWNGNVLYLAIDTDGAQALNLTVAGQKVEISDLANVPASAGVATAIAKDGDIVEMKIPFGSFYTLYNYGQTMDIAVELTGSEGTSGYFADAFFSSKEYKHSTAGVTQSASNAVTAFWGGSVSEAQASGQIGYTSTNDGNGNYTYRMWNKYQAGKTNYAIQRISTVVGKGNEMKAMTGTITMDFDLCIADMPAFTDPTSGNMIWRMYQPAGLGIGLGRYSDNSEELNLAITNMEDGLVMFVGYGPFTKTYGSNTVPYYGPFSLGKQVGDQFHVTLHYTEDGKVAAYVDDVLVMDFQDGGFSHSVPGLGIQFNLWSPYYKNSSDRPEGIDQILNTDSTPKNSDFDMDVEISNVKLGSTTCDNIFDLLSFDTIKGLNASEDQIASNLTLPTTLFDGSKLTSQVVWGSSNMQIIDGTGVVNTPAQDTAVKVTATLKGSAPAVTKSFDLTVVTPALDAWKRSFYYFDRGYTFAAESGKPSGAVAARWDDTNLYIGVQNLVGDKVSVTIGDDTFTGTDTITVPLSELALGTIKNGTIQSVAVTLAQGNVTVTKNLCLSFFGAEEDALAAYGNITLDGTKDAAWEVYHAVSGRPGSPVGEVGFLWNDGKLYVGMEYENADEMALTINGKTAYIDPAALTVVGVTGTVKKTDSFLEVEVLLSDFNFELLNYTQSVPVAVELIGAGGTSAFTTELKFISKAYKASAGAATQNAANAVTGLWNGNVNTAKSIGQIGYTSDKNADGTYTYRMWNKYVEGQTNQAIQRIMTTLGLANEMKALDGTITVDFDLCVADMPAYTDPTSGNVAWRMYQPVGLGIGLGRYNDNSEELNIAVTNMADGLVMFVGYGPFTRTYGSNTVPYYGPFSLGKQVGDQFHLTLRYTEDGKVAAYVDDTLVMEYQDGGFSHSVPGQGVQFNLWSPYYNSDASVRPEGIDEILNADSTPKNSDFDMDVEISNVKVGNLTCDDLLDLLTFDTIKNLNVNTDLVMTDLTLPATLTDGRLAAPLNWVSSNEAAISTTGVVNTDNEGKVTLTAKLGGQDSMSKKFNLTVAANVVDAWKGANYTEGRGYTFNPAGNATGEVNARWDDTNLYLQLENTNATKFSVAIGNKSYSANVSGGTAEIKVPLSELNLGTITNTTATAMNVTLTGSAGSATKKLQLSFFGVPGIATANWEDSITVNGTTDEGAWQFYRSFFGRPGSPVGKLSALWGNDSLYLGINTEGVNKVHLTLNGKKATVDLSTLTATGMDGVTAGKTDKAIEIAVPFASFGFKLYNYGQTTPVLVELEGEGGTSGFAANLAFTAKEHAACGPEGEYSAANAVTNWWNGSTTDAKASGQIGMTSEKDMNGSYTYHVWNKYVPGKTNYGIQRINVGKLNLGTTMQNLTGIIALDMDLRIDDMPAYDDPTSGDIIWRSYQPAGLGFALGRFNTNEEELNLAVSNTKNGLALYVGYGPFTKTYGSNTVPYYGPFYIDRELGEEFHLTFHYTEDGQVSAYVDDVLVMDFQDGGYEYGVAGLGVGITLWNPCYNEQLTGYMLNPDSSPKNAEANSDVYIGNLKVGSVSCYDLRDLITFDTIKGLNGSPDLIGKDLTLPTTVSDGNKLSADVSWSSSNTKVIANNGKVTTQDKNMAVKLTAKIGSFTKDFDLIVVLPTVDAWRTTSANVNGTLAEYHDFTRGYTFPEGTVNGAIAARWTKNTLYLAGKTNGDTMTITLGGKTIVANLSAKTVSGVSGASIAVGNGTVELGIPMSQLKLGTISQGTAKPMTVAFAKGSAKVQKSLSLTFYGVYETSMSSWNDGTIEIDGVLNEDWLMYTETTGRVGSPNGVIGKMWHESDLFLAVDTDGASKMIVTMGGKTATIDLTADPVADTTGLIQAIAKKDDIVEMKISYKDFFTLVNYGQVIDATVELVNEIGASGFNGGFEFTSREHLGAMNAANQSAANPVVDMYGNADDVAAAEKSGQVGYSDTEDENGRHTYHMWNKYQAGKKNYSVQRVMTSAAASQIPERFTDGTGTVTLDFDVQIDDMPVYDDPTSGDLVFRRYQAAGLGILLSRGIAGEELNFVISNTKDGLVLYVGTGPFTKDFGSGTIVWDGPYKLNKALGQEFHVMIHYTEKGEMALYADDELIYKLTEVGQNFVAIGGDDGLPGLIFSIWSATNKNGLANDFLDAGSAPKNSKADTDVTISDVRFGESSGTNILDLITYETIQNLNGDSNSVVSNLKLPSSISDGKITAKLSWSSSNRGVITNGGTVYPPDERTPVTMTVSLVGAKPAITKSFPLTAVMPFIDTWQTNFVKIDGDLSEYYSLTRGYTFAKSSGKPSASIAAGWNMDRSRLYYAIKYTNTDKITITMGSKVLVVDLKEQTVSGVKNAQMKLGKNNTVEIAVPLEQVRITEVKNNMLYDIGVKLENEKSSVSKNLTLAFYGQPSTALASWDNKTVVLDGKIEEQSWLLYSLIQGRPGTPEGSFGRLWNGTDLYLAVNTDGAKKMTLLLGEKTLTVDLTKATPTASGMSNVKIAKDGDFIELKIPMKSFGFTLHNYTETINMKLELSNSVGTSGFYGVLQFASREALFNGEAGEQSAANIHTDTFGDETVVKAAEESGQIGYTTEPTTTGYSYHMWNIYQEGKKNYPVQRVSSGGISYSQQAQMEAINGIMTVDFDVKIDDMPEYKDVEIPDTFFRRYQPAGLGVFIGRNLTGEEISFVITNELEGLALYMGSGPLDDSYGSQTVQWNGPYYIGKELGEQFHVSVHQTMKGEVQVYIDDQILYAFTDVGEDYSLGNSGVSFSLWNQWYGEKYNASFLNEDSSPKNADANTDLYVSNVQIGTATCYDLLDYLDFDYIKGNNGAYDNVITNLDLPSSLTDGKLKTAITWESSKPNVISNKGVVTTQSKDTTVIMKATLNGTDPVQYKEVETSVALPPVDSWYSEGVKVDGTLSEYHNFERGYTFEKKAGAVGAAWDTDMMYVGIKHTGAEKLTVKIEGKTLEVDVAKGSVSGLSDAKVAVGSNTVELAIPRSIIREKSEERGFVDMVITLTKGGTETEKGLRMTFYGRTMDGIVGWGGDSMKVDGSISEIAYQLYGQLDGRAGTAEGLVAKVWSGKDLYLAIFTDDAKTMKITLNGKTATINPKTLARSGDLKIASIAKGTYIYFDEKDEQVNGNLLEMKIPFANFGFDMYAYNLTADMTVEMTNNVGVSAYSTKMAFTNKVSKNYIEEMKEATYANQSSGRDNMSAGVANGNIGSVYRLLQDGRFSYRMWNIYDAAAPGWAENVASHNAVANDAYEPVIVREGDWYMDFDVKIDDMIEKQTTAHSIAAYGNDGLNFWLQRGITGQELTCGICYIEDEGLVFTVRVPETAVQEDYPIDRKLGETFHVSILWEDNGDITVFIDDEKLFTWVGGALGTRQKDASMGDGVLRLNLWSTSTWSRLADDTKSSDFTVSNILIGYAEDDSLLNQLTFDDIKGENRRQDEVWKDLVLPKVVTDGVVSSDIVWESSNPAVISVGNGVAKVVPQDEDTKVTLTVRMKGNKDIYKTFEITVTCPIVDAQLIGTAKTESYKLSDGSTVGARWNKDNIYLDIAHKGADTVNLTFGEKKIAVNLANKTVTGIDGAKVTTSGSKAEITLPRAALGITIPDYHHTERFTVELAKAGKAVASRVLKLEFVGYESIAAEYLNSQALKDFVATLKKVTSDITLPQTYTSQYVDGKLTMEWSSDTLRVLDNNGKVTRPSKVDALVRLSLVVDGKTLATYDVNVIAEGTPDLASTTELRVPFGKDIKIDGSISEQGWSMNSNLATADKVIGKMGVQWDTEYLYMAFQYNSAKALTITLDGKTANVNIANASSSGDLKIAQIKKGSYLELKIALKDIGLANIIDYGEKIAAKVMLDGATFEGTFTLSSMQWFATDNPAHRYVKREDTMDKEDPRKALQDNSTEETPDYIYAGWYTNNDGYYMYDIYGGADSKAAIVTSMSFVNSTLAGTEVFAPMEKSGEVSLYTEFDIQTLSMPIYKGGTSGENKVGSHTFMATAGLSWQIGGYANKIEKTSEWLSMGMYMSEGGLVIMVRVGNDFYSFPIGKQNGDMFRIGVGWDTEDTLHLFVDGEKIGEVEKAVTYGDTMSNGGIGFRITRNANAAACESDSFKINISNLAMGYYYGECMVDNITFNDIRDKNINAEAVTMDLNLMDEYVNPQLSSGKLTWESTGTAVAPNGTVTRPEDKSYDLNRLTVTNELGHSKEIITAVKGFKEVDDMLFLRDDYDTYHGVGQKYVGGAFINFDMENTSVIKDLKETQRISVVKITALEHESRLDPDNITLWVSDDNANYTPVKGFKLLHKDNDTYLYGFDVEARYVKIHSSHFDSSYVYSKCFLPEMLNAYYEEIIGDNGESFGTKKTVTVKNTESYDMMDMPWTFTAQELGIVSLAEDMADVRIFQGDELLYHYVEDGKITVRIPEVKAGAKVKLTVLSGNKDALDISNKEGVHEVLYGTVEMFYSTGKNTDEIYDPYYRTRCMAVTNDGTIITTVRANSSTDENKVDCRVWLYSKDHGRTWTYMGVAEEFMVGPAPGGMLYDHHANVLYSYGYTDHPDGREGLEMGMVKLDLNNGVENAKWEYVTCLTKDRPRSFNYNDGTVLSCYDGDGPNVDMVVIIMASGEGEDGNPTGVNGDFCAYTTDAGKTWEHSEGYINIPGIQAGFEAGVSEPTSLELDDGTLIMTARYQDLGVNSFAYSYSLDHGITWSEPVASEIYTVNTQPMFLETHDEFDVFCWAGNNIQGGESYQRYPQNLAIPVVKEDYSNIGVMAVQNTYQRTYFQNLKVDNSRNTNLFLTYTHDGALLIDSPIGSLHMLTRVDDYKNYITKTKGSYDSFENSTTRFEGWSDIDGMTSVTDKMATDGKYSMMMFGQSVRSVPYFREGSVSFDLYWDGAEFKLELETTYSPEFMYGSPAAMVIDHDGNVLDGYGNDTGIDVQEGWNKIEMVVDLPNGSVTVAANGSEAGALSINPDFDEYVTYIALHADNYVYIDNFTQIGEPADVKPESKDDGDNGFDLTAILCVGVPVLIAAAVVAVVLLKKKAAKPADDAETTENPETPDEQ